MDLKERFIYIYFFTFNVSQKERKAEHMIHKILESCFILMSRSSCLSLVRTFGIRSHP